MKIRTSARGTGLAITLSALLAACGSYAQARERTPSAPAAHNAVMVPPVVYGNYRGIQMSESGDACGVPGPLRQAVKKALEARHTSVLSEPSAGMGATPSLKIEVIDIVTVSAGGPAIVVIRAVLERPGQPAVQFTAQRQMHTKHTAITADTTECSAMEGVTRELGVDIAKWMRKPADGVFLVNGR